MVCMLKRNVWDWPGGKHAECLCLADYYRRQSALRTISGGICRGLIVRFVLFVQLLLLGYQRIVRSSGLNGSSLLLDLPSI